MTPLTRAVQDWRQSERCGSGAGSWVDSGQLLLAFLVVAHESLMGRLRWVIMPLFGLQGPIEVFSAGCAVGGWLGEASAAGQRHGGRPSTSWRYGSSGPGEFECCTPGKAFAGRTNLMILTP